MDVTELEFYIYRSIMVFSASVLESRCLHVIPQAVRTIKGVADVHLRHAQKLEQQLVVPSIGKLNLEAAGSHCRHPSSVSPVFASSTLLLRCPLNRKLQSRANSPPVIYVSDNHRAIATTQAWTRGWIDSRIAGVPVVPFWSPFHQCPSTVVWPRPRLQHHTPPNRPELQSLHRESPSLSTSPPLTWNHHLSQPQNGFQGESESPEHPRPALLQLVPNAKLHPPPLGS